MIETTTSARRRLLGAIATTALLVGALAPAPASADPCIALSSKWQTLPVSFPEGSRAVVSVATFRFDPVKLLVANDRSVLRSSDGGCTFHTAVSLGGMEGFGPDDRITDVTFAPDDPTRVYALVEEAGGVPRPHVIWSQDGGADWSRLDTGLEGATGSPLDLAVSARAGLLYLLVGGAGAASGEERIATTPTLYRNADHGAWQLTAPAEFGAPVTLPPLTTPDDADVHGVLVDPNDLQQVWVWGHAGLFRSTDFAASFDRVLDRPISAVDLIRSFQEGFRLIALDAESAQAHVSFSGTTFNAIRLPATAQAVASTSFRFVRHVLVATLVGRVYQLTSFEGSAREISASRAVTGLASGVAGNAQVVYGRTASTVERLILPQPTFSDPEIPPLPPIEIEVPGKRDLQKPALLPASDRILLSPGERRRVPVRLILPGTRRVDVFFLIDTSGSMGEEIAGVRAAMGAIANELGRQGVDANFGVGQFRGFDYAPVYDRVLDITDDREALENALGELAAGGGVFEESNLEALEQIATGAGELRGQEDVPAGQNVHFRKGSLRVIVHATDETIGRQYPNPTPAEAAAALNSIDALQVGLAFQQDPPPPPPARDPLRAPDNPREGLRDMAVRTHAVAPAQGADCDGDGAADVAPDEPLVCMLDPSRAHEASVMAPAIVGLLLGLKDIADVRLIAEGPPGTVANVDPDVFPRQDFKQNLDLPFGVTLACPEGSIGRTMPISLRAVARGATLATGATEIVCGARVVPQIPPIPPLIIQPPVQSQPVPQGNPQPQPQGNPQAAFAAQKQEQPQLAYGYINPKKQAPAPQRAGPSEDRFAMSRYRDPADRVPPAATLLTGAAMAAAFAVVTRRRIRLATVRVHTRTTRRRNR